MEADYFRTLAARCMRAARTCFDLNAQKELRELADEFKRKAHELEEAVRERSMRG